MAMHPVFDRLVDEMDVRGWAVELTVCAGPPRKRKGGEYRELEALRVRRPDRELSATQIIRDGDLEAAARALL